MNHFPPRDKPFAAFVINLRSKRADTVSKVQKTTKACRPEALTKAFCRLLQ
jgi:hypothetical protein